MRRLINTFQELRDNTARFLHYDNSHENDSSRSSPPKPSFYLPANSPSLDLTLCDVCRYIDISTLLKHELDQDDALPLGPLNDLRAKTDCALCRLITSTITKSWGLESLDDPICAGIEETMCYIYSRNLPVNSTESVGRIRLLARPKPSAVLRAQPNWSMHTINLNEILLLGDDAEKVGRGPEHHGRLVHPGCVGMGRIREWVDVCEEFHQLQCIGEMERNAGRIPDCLHLIDVKENRLVSAEKGMRYCALSYVWVAVTTVSLYRTTMANISRRMEVGGLSGIEFPRTIRDAITLVGDIEQRYLWVDAVCIIQDDPIDQKAQIGVMNMIYGASWLTIVAAAGQDAHASLPRAQHDPEAKELRQHLETVQGFRLMVPLYSLEETLEKAKWATRGWTYQERMLPCRRLYFTEEQVYFECRHGFWCEDVAMEERTTSPNSLRFSESAGNSLAGLEKKGPHLGRERFFGRFHLAVADYSMRDVSFDSDVLNAFLGVGNTLAAAFDQEFYYGLPAWHLEQALTWQPSVVPRRRDTLAAPSWSWAGWRASVTYSVKWKNIGGSTIIYSLVDDWYLHTAENTRIRLDVKRADGFGQTRRPNHPPPPASPPAEERPSGLRPGTLEFVTTTAHFRVRPGCIHAATCPCFSGGSKPAQSHVERIQSIDIIDQNGDVVGSILLDLEIAKAIDIFNTPGEFVIIAHGSGGNEPCPIYDTGRWEKKSACLYEVLLVEWNDGIASRVGLGIASEYAVRRLSSAGLICTPDPGTA